MKVMLLSERHAPHYWRGATPIKKSLPFYERIGEGYVHRVRSAAHHYTSKDGSMTHTSYHFWCGAVGFLYPAGKQNRKKKPAVLTAELTAGRVLCATCEARAIGAGQLGLEKIGEHFVKYRPHADFFAIR